MKGFSSENYEPHLLDNFVRKNRGVFYTPAQYAEKALELVREAIARVPAGNDYIILDRCAGIGNLEAGLTDEELSHCVLSSLDSGEQQALVERFGSRVRHIVLAPDSTDALSEAFVRNAEIQKWVDDPQCSVILLENPPYSDVTSIEHQKAGMSKKSSCWKDSYVHQKMCEAVKGSARNELANLFIWSAFRFYVREPTDSYIVFAPVKYWKAHHLIDKEFLGGFAFNRRHFGATEGSCVMCACWGGANANNECLSLKGFDIDGDGRLTEPVDLLVKKVYSRFSQAYYDKTPIDDAVPTGILCGLDGYEVKDGLKRKVSPLYSPSIVGYLAVEGFGFDNCDTASYLGVTSRYDGNGFYLTRENFLEKLPVFAASRYCSYNRTWTETGRIMKTGDGCERFYRDVRNGKLDEFLYDCLLFTCLERQNHMVTFVGSDGREYRNELRLGSQECPSLAGQHVFSCCQFLTSDKMRLLDAAAAVYALVDDERKDEKGIYQIAIENDVMIEVDGKRVRKNRELHDALMNLRKRLAEFYKTRIVPILFEYEFLK